MEKFKRILRWGVLNGCWYALAILGTFLALPWAWNVFIFLTWLMVFCGTLTSLGMLAGETMGKPLGPYTRPVPLWLDSAMDLGITAVIVAFGHWFYGVLLLIQMLEYAYCFKDSKPVTPVAP